MSKAPNGNLTLFWKTLLATSGRADPPRPALSGVLNSGGRIYSVRQINKFDCCVSCPRCLSEKGVALAVLAHDLISPSKFARAKYSNYFCLL